MATNFSPSSGSYVLNYSQVSASGAIQGHHGPLVMIEKLGKLEIFELSKTSVLWFDYSQESGIL